MRKIKVAIADFVSVLFFNSDKLADYFVRRAAFNSVFGKDGFVYPTYLRLRGFKQGDNIAFADAMKLLNNFPKTEHIALDNNLMVADDIRHFQFGNEHVDPIIMRTRKVNEETIYKYDSDMTGNAIPRTTNNTYYVCMAMWNKHWWCAFSDECIHPGKATVYDHFMFVQGDTAQFEEDLMLLSLTQI